MEATKTASLVEALACSAAVTVLVTLASSFLPERAIAISVAGVFLAATWLFVWRKDDAYVERCGLALGGLVLPGTALRGRLVRSTVQALLWTALFAAIFFVPFTFGWKAFWHPRRPFVFDFGPELRSFAFGQLVIIALPEEAFYRGYLQSRLDEVFPRRVRILGADVGVSLVVTSAIFALGHMATIRDPARLAVFFPSLLFGWLRARTGGIGAGVFFHTACNVFSELLGKGFRMY